MAVYGPDMPRYTTIEFVEVFFVLFFRRWNRKSPPAVVATAAMGESVVFMGMEGKRNVWWKKRCRRVRANSMGKR